MQVIERVPVKKLNAGYMRVERFGEGLSVVERRSQPMLWKPLIIIISFILALLITVAGGIYLLIDNSCTKDQVSLEKRCQIALSYHRY